MIKDLIFKTPEQEGLDSKHIIKFLDQMDRYKVNLHSFLMARNGNIIAEGYYKPFDKDFKHRLYSCSKTFVALAIGMMVGEGKIKVTDKICDYFPEMIEVKPDKWLEETTIEDLLTMSTSYHVTTYHDRKFKEWAKTFFNRYKSTYPSGSIYRYNTSASFILDVLLEKISGKPFLEYLRPIFDMIGVSTDIWCVKSPDGYSWGGSGVVCTLRDFAKVGEFLLNKGNVNGMQLIPLDFMEKACSPLVNQISYNEFVPYAMSGYGYQIWCFEDGAYGMRGMGMQIIYCNPKKNFLFACQADTQGSDHVASLKLFEMLNDDICANFSDYEIEQTNYAQLAKRLQNLSVDNVKFGMDSCETEKKINGVKFILNDNDFTWKWFRLNFESKDGYIEYENARGVKRICFGKGRAKIGTFPETHYYDVQVDTPSNRELDCYAISSWLSDKELLIRVYVTDTGFGNLFIKMAFKGDDVGVSLVKIAEFFMDEYNGLAGGTAEK